MVHLIRKVGDSGHSVYYASVRRLQHNGKQLIFLKRNKCEGDRGKFLSELECAFSKVACGYFKRLSPPYGLVIRGDETLKSLESAFKSQEKNRKKYATEFGDAAQDYEIIEANNELLKLFESQSSQSNKATQELQKRGSINGIASGNIKQFYPEGKEFTFIESIEAKVLKSNGGSMDKESLANVLLISYLLGEDDLHGGNWGIFKAASGPKTEALYFFKIDHDLMFSGEIMSYLDPRLANLHYNERAFDIHPNDLNNFPDIHHSQNHYWPTKDPFFAKGKKAYHSKEIRAFFKKLKEDKIFIDRKWEFLWQFAKESHLLSFDKPNEIISDATKCLVNRALIGRQQKLRVALSLSDYRRRESSVKRQISAINRRNNLNNQAESKNLFKGINLNDQVGSKDLFKDINIEEDCLLTASIKLGCYSPEEHSQHELNHYRGGKDFYEMAKCFHHNESDLLSEHRKFKYYQMMLDFYLKGVPCEQAEEDPQNKKDLIKVFKEKKTLTEILSLDDFNKDKDFVSAVLSLQPTQSVVNRIKEAQCELYNFLSPVQVNPQDSLNQLIQQIKQINQNPYYSLKTAKNLTLALVRASTFTDKSCLEDFRDKLKTDPDLKFIRQLRSKLWIVRKIRGLYGMSSTYLELNSLLKSKTLLTDVIPNSIRPA